MSVELFGRYSNPLPVEEVNHMLPIRMETDQLESEVEDADFNYFTINQPEECPRADAVDIPSPHPVFKKTSLQAFGE